MLSAGACASAGPTVAVEAGCTRFKPIRPLATDWLSVSRHLEDQILIHNETWATACQR
jgi:hypothetical protein